MSRFLPEWLAGKTADAVAAEKKAADEAAKLAREEVVAKARAAGKKFHDDVFKGEHVHKTSKQLAKEELAKRQAEAKAVTIATQTKPTKSAPFAGFGDVSAEQQARFHSVNPVTVKNKAAIDALRARPVVEAKVTPSAVLPERKKVVDAVANAQKQAAFLENQKARLTAEGREAYRTAVAAEKAREKAEKVALAKELRERDLRVEKIAAQGFASVGKKRFDGKFAASLFGTKEDWVAQNRSAGHVSISAEESAQKKAARPAMKPKEVDAFAVKPATEENRRKPAFWDRKKAVEVGAHVDPAATSAFRPKF